MCRVLKHIAPFTLSKVSSVVCCYSNLPRLHKAMVVLSCTRIQAVTPYGRLSSYFYNNTKAELINSASPFNLLWLALRPERVLKQVP